MFCKSQGAQLTSTYLEDDTIIVWKEFENCFTMIGIVKGYTEKMIRDLLDVIFNATIFSIGLNEVKHNKNPEQLKRELKVCILFSIQNEPNSMYDLLISLLSIVSSKNAIQLLIK